MSQMPSRTAGRRSSLREEIGATAVEYALLVALIAVVILGAVELVGDNLSGGFGQVSNAMAGAGGGNAGGGGGGGGNGGGGGGGNGGGGGGGNGANNNGQGGGVGNGVGGGRGNN